MEEEFTEINDIRTSFKGITFSNFKKTEVLRQLTISLQESKIEPANYWTCELITSGNFLSIWEVIIHFYSKYIQISNPKLIIYLDIRFNNFKDILNFGYRDCELRLRNNIKIRKLFAEIICTLCLSKRNHIFQEIKIKQSDFTLTNITDKLKAPNVDLIIPFFKEKDPKYLFIQLNEFVYNIHHKNCIDSCYWFEHIINYESFMKKNKEKCICEKRPFKNINQKEQNDIIWIFWEIFFYYSKKNKILIKIVESCFNLFSIKYSSSSKHKRKYMIYFTITLITGNVICDTETIKNKKYITSVLSRINNIYLQVKENEVSPQTEYLFSGVKTSKNFEKTIHLLEKMNNIEKEFIPRDENNETIN